MQVEDFLFEMASFASLQTCSNVEVKIFPNCNANYPPGNDHISHQTGKGKLSTQKCRLKREYVCSQEGNYCKMAEIEVITLLIGAITPCMRLVGGSSLTYPLKTDHITIFK